jgi:hypothetical protein
MRSVTVYIVLYSEVHNAARQVSKREKEGRAMKGYAPFTIAVTAIAIAFVWSLAKAQLNEEMVPMPLPATASLSGTGPVTN